ncbi:hypothetical protein MMC10_006149 [Thelotrema lepadinum]|nr:hypothetical protein [Thelotrema lepadinum]
MEGPRVVLILFLLIFLLSSPDTQRPTPNQQREFRKVIEEERHGLRILNRTKQRDFDPLAHKWVNLTGLRGGDGYAWDLLPQVKSRAREQAQAVLGTTQIQSGRQSVYSLTHGEFGERYNSFENLDGGEALPSLIPFYQNVTGLVHGKWIRSKAGDGFGAPSPNLTAISPTQYVTREYNRNITASRGELSLKLDEKRSASVQVGLNTAREIKAELTIQDKTSSGDGWEMTLYGVHFVESGSVLLTTSGEKFAGIFALPHFVRSDGVFDATQQLLNETIPNAINKQEWPGDHSTYPWASSQSSPAEIMFPTPHCEYLVYLQQHFVWPYEPTKRWATFLQGSRQRSSPFSSSLVALENELRAPTGAALNFIPDLRFSAVIFSPDCGFVLESEDSSDSWYHDPGHHLKGPKAEAFVKTLRRAVEIFGLIVAAQIFLLMRQMKDASTPSTKSRISYNTIAMMALGDGFAFLSSMILSLFVDTAYLTIVTMAYLAFLCVSFFGMKFLIDVWSVQAPERQERERQRQRRREQQGSSTRHQPTTSTAASTAAPAIPQPNAPAVVITPAGADTLPLPATTRPSRDTGATPIILPSDQDIDAEIADGNTPATAQTTTLGSANREMGQMYSRFYFLLIAIIFLSLNASTWPIALRSIYANFLALVYLSFWVPQIKRNIIRNCRKALRWEFVFGQSVLRLIPFAYFYAYEDNILFARTDWNMLYIFAAWMWAQVLLLISQEILGPRFLVPNGWAPPAYDYHPILREDDEETGSSMPIGFNPATSSVDFPSASSGESKERGKWSFDCAICMHSLEVPVKMRNDGHGDSTTSSTLGANLFTRRAYMVTPCRHIFHSICLEGWMKYKLQCPICRESLPPL